MLGLDNLGPQHVATCARVLRKVGVLQMPSCNCLSETLVALVSGTSASSFWAASRPQDPRVPLICQPAVSGPFPTPLTYVCATHSAPLPVRINIKHCQIVNLRHPFVLISVLEGISILVFPAALVRNCVHLQIIKIPKIVAKKDESVLNNFFFSSQEAWKWSSRLEGWHRCARH